MRRPRPIQTGIHLDENQGTSHFSRRRIVVILASLLAMMTAMAMIWAIWKWLPALPVKEVTFSGEITHISEDRLKQFAYAIRGNLWRLNLADIQAAARQLPGVRNAEVSRRFPDSLHIRIEEHQPFARWINAEGRDELMLVNTHGEVFKPDAVSDDETAKMPVFIGPEGHSIEVLKQYAEFEKTLAVIERRPVAVSLSSRYAWKLTLDNGARLELGRSDTDARLARLVSAWPQVAALREAEAQIDLRYNNGFALKSSASPGKDKKDSVRQSGTATETRNG